MNDLRAWYEYTDEEAAELKRRLVDSADAFFEGRPIPGPEVDYSIGFMIPREPMT